jgi:hypothetical protein
MDKADPVFVERLTLLDRLRAYPELNDGAVDLIVDSIDEIERLQSELAAARGKALREAIDELDKHPDASGSRYIEALLSPISQATEKT